MEKRKSENQKKDTNAEKFTKKEILNWRELQTEWVMKISRFNQVPSS